MKTNVLLILLLLPGFLTAQGRWSSVTHKDIKESATLRLSYLSSLIYPGAAFGIQFPIRTRIYHKTSRSGDEKTSRRDRFWSANIGFYHHPTLHDHLMLHAAYGMRRTGSKGIFLQINPGIGVSRTFLDGVTYEVDNQGNIKTHTSSGSFYAMLMISAGIGKDFSIQHPKTPLSVFLNLNLPLFYPYNSLIYFRPTLELGCSYRFRHFLETKKSLTEYSK